MSRYLILIILNAPLILIGMINTIVGYKLKHMSKRRFMLGILFWLILFTGLIAVRPVYSFLFSNNLTKTEPLSLFDVIQITGIIFTLLIANRAYGRVDLLERRVHDLHQELSIRLSEGRPSKDKK